MLLQRIITALILIPLVVMAVFMLPLQYFALFIGLIVLLAGWEWTNLIGMEKIYSRLFFLLMMIIPILGIYYWTVFLEVIAQSFDWPEVRKQSGLLEWLVVPPVLFWFINMLLIRNAPSAVLALELKTLYRALMGWFVLIAAWMFVYRIRAFYGAEMMMYFLLLIWVADICAYFVGKKYGETKLAPEISPGKTIAGFYGALVSGILCGVALGLIYGFNIIIGSDFVLLSALTVLVSIYGDLFFSLIKRQSGVKDSGSLLPGHGGILDRIDSIIAAAPLFYAGIILIRGQF